MQKCVSRKDELTVCFTTVKPNQEADNAADHEEKAEEIKLPSMLSPSHSFVWVQVQEEEQHKSSNATSGPVNDAIL